MEERKRDTLAPLLCVLKTIEDSRNPGLVFDPETPFGSNSPPRADSKGRPATHFIRMVSRPFPLDIARDHSSSQRTLSRDGLKALWRGIDKKTSKFAHLWRACLSFCQCLFIVPDLSGLLRGGPFSQSHYLNGRYFSVPLRAL